ncbi:hypothetical protein [Natrarchaeobius chitinivorans]|uniref:hypothetical protein n=1 Tax=Natrarchaeobius chitinivorans TaxID=1679083 RepID=UPI000F53904E|nr:hypothetical protein [Natrarchaeobius chitinivorans]
MSVLILGGITLHLLTSPFTVAFDLPTVVFLILSSVLTFGLPLFLYLYYDFLVPVILLVAIASVWAYGGLTGGGDSSAAGLMLAFVYVYVPLYLVAGGLEYVVKTQILN